MEVAFFLLLLTSHTRANAGADCPRPVGMQHWAGTFPVLCYGEEKGHSGKQSSPGLQVSVAAACFHETRTLPCGDYWFLHVLEPTPEQRSFSFPAEKKTQTQQAQWQQGTMVTSHGGSEPWGLQHLCLHLPQVLLPPPRTCCDSSTKHSCDLPRKPITPQTFPSAVLPQSLKYTCGAGASKAGTS